MGREPNKWWTLTAVSVAIFMLLLDITVVNVALPDIQSDLDSSFDDLQWVVDAYSLTLAAFLLTAGSAADRIGRRSVFIAGLVVFCLASIACGLSHTPLMLNLSRGVQGVGGAMMFATSLALIAQAFHGKDRGTAFGVFGAVTGGAVAVGPLVGGAIVEGIGWEWVFFINVPIGILTVVGTLLYVRESHDPTPGRMDIPGFATFSAALFLLVFALVRGNSEGWGSPLIVGFLVSSVVLLAAFVAIEMRAEHPMLDLSLFRNRSFAGAAIVAFCLSGSMFSMFLYLTLYIQNVLGYSPLEAGVRFLPVTLLSFFVAPISGRLSARVPVRLLLGTGLLLVGVGLLAMTVIDADSEWTALLPGFLFCGVGIGLTNPPLASTQVGVVHPRESGMASGIGNTFRQVGIATGIAAYGAIFEHTVVSKTPRVLGQAASDLPAEVLASGRVGEFHNAALEQAARVGFTGALSDLLVIAAVVALLGSVAGYALVRQSDFVVPPDAPGG
ncbi:MAG: MFS transporter [Solirubrobacteraceae bacterium]|nr:MFS transporter [Solirubrobacteraceae bacterium]